MQSTLRYPALVLLIRLAVSVKWAHHSIMLVAFRPEGAVNAVVCHEWLVPSVCGLLPDFVGCAQVFRRWGCFPPPAAASAGRNARTERGARDVIQLMVGGSASGELNP